jgi:putative membrane protein
MSLDANLAIFHHLLAFGLVGLAMAEWAVLRGAVSAESVRFLPKLDLAYGIVAVLLLIVGALRVIYGIKGYAFYTGNPVFWLKIAFFAATGLLSIIPTVAFIRWARALKASGALPDPTQWIRTRRLVTLELHLLAVVMIFAAIMARGIGLS